jgi:hypothetical protein
MPPVFFNALWPFVSEKNLSMIRKHMGLPKSNWWWGEYPGDIQIMRVRDSRGPKVELELVTTENGMNLLKITEKRLYTIDGKTDIRSVTVPANPANNLFKEKKRTTRKVQRTK